MIYKMTSKSTMLSPQTFEAQAPSKFSQSNLHKYQMHPAAIPTLLTDVTGYFSSFIITCPFYSASVLTYSLAITSHNHRHSICCDGKMCKPWCLSDTQEGGNRKTHPMGLLSVSGNPFVDIVANLDWVLP